jgi:hypothetical protein
MPGWLLGGTAWLLGEKEDPKESIAWRSGLTVFADSPHR